MTYSDQNNVDVVVAGFGSPHGDDQAGWRIVEVLAQGRAIGARLAAISESTQLLDELEGCRRLIVVDGCRSGSQIGEISRLQWPDPRIRQYHNHSTHGVGVCNALQLAERLGHLPPRVEIFGIEIGGHQPLAEMSRNVVQAVAEVAETIYAELSEAVHA